MQPTNSVPASSASPNPSAAPKPGPVMDVVVPPPDKSNSPDTAKADTKSPAPESKSIKQAPAKPTTPKQPSSGTGLAIFATVIIVLGLAALATYAYIKTR
ncbi:MAG TPA: hypothetical protein VK712_00515 [Verrucomicrobiae bacterium]|nr:hypothetical protein [Verrucomicrobiae bacterium]